MNEDMIMSGGADGGTGGGVCPSSSSKDMFGCSIKGVRGSGIPDFLAKTYTIVNDPNTNAVVSWSLLGNSFILWDHIKFSSEILPRFFKHNNLSSFAYQLNNYGFRKIGVEHQWEYENPHFQAGKEYLLANIRRRGQNREIYKRNPSHRRINDNRLEIKAEIMRNELRESKLEIEKLKTQQSEMESRITAVESEIRDFEIKSKSLVACWDGMFKTEMARKEMKLGENEETGLVKFEGLSEKTEAIEKYAVWNVSDENQSVSSAAAAADYSEVGVGNNSADIMYLARILQEEDGVCESEMENNKQADIALVLQDLIA